MMGRRPNPRYVNYARVHGRTIDDQIEHDHKRWPGGSSTGFLLWNTARLAEFAKLHPEAFVVGGHLVDHNAYDAWLDSLPVLPKESY
jgi:hypothetical protein